MSKIRGNANAEPTSIIVDRWSPRSFDRQRPVTRDALYACIEAARWAPSCFGDEPWRFIVCDKASHPDAWDRLLSCLAEKNREWAVHAPVLIMISAADQFRNGKPNRWGQYDTGQAAVSLCIEATALGLVTHQMGGFDPAGVRAAFSIPDGYTPMAALAMGYAADAGLLSDEGFRNIETAPRSRQPVASCFGMGHWPGEE